MAQRRHRGAGGDVLHRPAGLTENDKDLTLGKNDFSDSLNTTPLVILGFPQVGETVSVDVSGWGPSGITFDFAWYLDGVEIVGPETNQYTVQLEDIGHELSAGVTATKSGYLTSIATSPPLVVASTFADVPVGHPFNLEIEWMRAADLANGYLDNGYRTYHPIEDVSRQAMAAFLYRLAGSPAIMLPAEPSFADVPFDHPFSTPIEWMKAEGISNGNVGPGGTIVYLPLEAVTRQSMAAFLYRNADNPPFDPPATATFSDVPVGHPFFKEIEWMKAEGITNGNVDGSYGAIDPVSRQAMAAFLYRYTH